MDSCCGRRCIWPCGTTSIWFDMEKKLKVLIIGGFPPRDGNIYGGIVSACQALLHSSFPERFELILVDSTQRLIPLPPIWFRGWYGIARLWRVLWLIEKRKPDAVIAFASLGMSIVEKSLFMIYARLRGVPSLLLLRGGELMDQCRASIIYRQFLRLLLSAPTYLLCQGESWQDFFARDMGFPRARCPVVKNWTATADLLAIGKHKNYAVKGDLRLLFVGWLDDVKGVWHLLEAFRDLIKLEGIPALKLSFAGEGTLSAPARDRKSTRLNSSHVSESRMPSSA